MIDAFDGRRLATMRCTLVPVFDPGASRGPDPTVGVRTLAEIRTDRRPLTMTDNVTQQQLDDQLRPYVRSEGLRQRPGDQQLPVSNDRPGAHDQLIAQLVARRELGLARYGQLLQPHNGRDTGRDLVEELLDGAVYAQTLAVELADLRGVLAAARATLAEAEQQNHRLPYLAAAVDVLDHPQPGHRPSITLAENTPHVDERRDTAAAAVLDTLSLRGTAVTAAAALDVADAVLETVGLGAGDL